MSGEAVASYRSMKVLGGVCALIVLGCALFLVGEDVSLPSLVGHWLQLGPRCVLVLLAFSAAEAVRCEWLTNLRVAQKDCAFLVTLLASYSLALSLMDLLTAVALMTAPDAVLGQMAYTLEDSSDSSKVMGRYHWTVLVALFWAGCEGALGCVALLALQRMNVADSWLKEVGLDRASVLSCAREMGILSRRSVFNERVSTLGASGGNGTGTPAVPAVSPVSTVSGECDVEAPSANSTDAMPQPSAAQLAASAALARHASAPPQSGNNMGRRSYGK